MRKTDIENAVRDMNYHKRKIEEDRDKILSAIARIEKSMDKLYKVIQNHELKLKHLDQRLRNLERRAILKK